MTSRLRQSGGTLWPGSNQEAALLCCSTAPHLLRKGLRPKANAVDGMQAGPGSVRQREQARRSE